MRRLLICLFLLCSISAVAQDLVVSDASTAEPLDGVTVADLQGNKGTETNKLGQAWLTQFNASDTLILSRVGHHELFVFPKDRAQLPLRLEMIPQVTQVDEAVILVYGEETKRKSVPQPIKTISKADIRLQQPNTAVDHLMNSGSILVQKSQLGGGSPIIRGFEANKILLVLDGVRMNNAIYRSGHLQNAITIDPMVLQKTDIFFGPGAVMFGSDALGGVLHFSTRDPILQPNANEKPLTSLNLRGSIGSAAQSKSLHADVMVGGHKWGMLTSITHSDFGDLRMGTWRPHGDNEWGLVRIYTDREEGVDVVRENGNPNIQRGTGYDQTDFLQKVLFRPSELWEMKLNLQFSTSSDVPRFDRLNDVVDGQPRFAEWYYGPQNRLFTSLSAIHKPKASRWADRIELIASYQRIDEDRINRRFGRDERNIQQEDVDVISANLNLSKLLFAAKEKSAQHKLNYGAEWVSNVVSSTARSENILTGESSPITTRYPNGGSNTWSAGAYASIRSEWSAKVATAVGGRYNLASYRSTFLPDEVVSLPFSEVETQTGALTGNVGAVWTPDSLWKISSTLSTGFRNPNVDDYGKVFERDGFVVVPNNTLRPERISSAELTASRLLADNKLRVTVTGYAALLQDAIVRRNFDLNGDTLLVFDGELSRIQTNLNAAEAVVYGGSAEINAELRRDLSAKASINYTYGQDTSSDTPLAHIPPLFGKVGLSYFVDDFRGELFALVNGAKPADLFAPGSTDNPAEALAEGYPAWWTLNLKTSFRISQKLTTDFSLENILDRHYKVFASGLSSPGIDARLTVHWHLN